MNDLPDERNNSIPFYGWLVVAACFSATFVQGAAMWTSGVFFKPLLYEFDWSRAQVSSSFTAFQIGYALSSIIAGRLGDRCSPRPILLISAVLVGFGNFLCSQVHMITQLRLFLFIAGLGVGATWTVPSSAIQRWFYNRKRAGLALGIVVSGVGVGAQIFAPFINFLIIRYGWRTTYEILGIIFFGIIAISSLVIKRSPVEGSNSSGGMNRRPNAINSQGSVTSRVVTTPSFVGITITHCAVVLAFLTISTHLIPHATDVGISPTTSAAALGILGGLSIPGRIIAGLLSDRLYWQKIMTVSIFALAISLLWLLFLRETWMLYCFVIFYGLSHGSRAAAYVGILGEFFGMVSLGELIGITMAMGMFIGAFAPYIAGFMFDITNSYFSFFIIVMMLLLGSGVIAITIKKPDLPG